jgi:hypothetical protein
MARKRRNPKSTLMEELEEQDKSIPEEKRIQDLIDAVERACCYFGSATLMIGKDGYIFVREDKGTGHYISDPEKIKNILLEKYKIEEGIYINVKYWSIEPKVRETEFFVLVLDVLRAPDDIQHEFEQFKGKLIKIDELSGDFKIQAGALGTFLLYKGYVCSRVFFSRSKLGWYNLTHDKTQSPDEYLKR